MKFVVFCLALGSLVFSACSQPPIYGQEAQSSKSLSGGQTSDEELQTQLGLVVADLLHKQGQLEPLLNEILKRGRAKHANKEGWIEFLEGQVEILRHVKFPLSGAEPEHGMSGELYLLPIVTVLRRLEGELDPVKISVDGLDGEFTVDTLPVLKTSLSLNDSELERLLIYGTRPSDEPWPSRWQIIVADGDGRQMKHKHVKTGSGTMIQPVILQEGAGLAEQLNVADFVEITKPGKYKLQLLFHNTYPLANSDSIADLVILKSAEYEFTVR